MSKLMAYRCPHCDKTVDVDPAQAGETIVCPSCNSPFHAEVPSARPIEPDAKGLAHGVTTSSDERTIEVVHPAMFREHPLVFVLAVLAFAAGCCLLVMFATGGLVLGLNPTAAVIIGLAVLLIPGIYLLEWWIQTRATTLIVTNERTIYRRGIFSRRTSEVRHEDVRNLQVNQSLTDRMFGVGDLAISSAGQDDLEISAKGIPHPNHIADIIRERQ